MARFLISLSAVSLLALGACAQASAPGLEPVNSRYSQPVEKIVFVAAETRPCIAGVARMTCLQVRDSEDEPWTLHYFGFDGFEHHPGVEYRLRVRGAPVANPPADASSMYWSLIEILDQKPQG
jgi:hypothetical protein